MTVTALTGPLLRRTRHVRAVDRAGGQVSVTGAAAGPHHFQVGVVPLSVRCGYAPAMRDFRALYADDRIEDAPPGAIQIDVARTSDRLRWWRRYEVCADGVLRYCFGHRRAILPHIEWAINWQIMHFLPRYYEIHAGVLEIEGQGVVFPAVSGSGKSTLIAALLTRGWRYLSDEFALIDPESLWLHPYPKAICIKQGSFAVLEKLGHAPDRRRTYIHRKEGLAVFVNPRQLGLVRRDPCPVRHIMFCEYRGRQAPSISRIPRAEAVLRLNAQSFNFMKFQARGIEIMSNLVRQARCYVLQAGPIAETCDLVASTVGAPSTAGSAPPTRRSGPTERLIDDRPRFTGFASSSQR